MTIDEAREAILQRWTTQWGAAQPAVPFTFENERFEEPSSGQWAWLVVLERGSQQATLGPPGARKFERRGSIVMKLFGPIDAGSRGLSLLAQSARVIFEGVSFSGIRCMNAPHRTVGSDGRWFQVVVEADFAYDETR